MRETGTLAVEGLRGGCGPQATGVPGRTAPRLLGPRHLTSAAAVSLAVWTAARSAAGGRAASWEGLHYARPHGGPPGGPPWPAGLACGPRRGGKGRFRRSCLLYSP